ncbi:nitronate monooxygenase [Marchantia polymorpha subsp. ruderalis]|uniref:Nitronate monooxygenase domain-containing protein n=2 Tax=Marchantia polymorpha TaxID=3197 RepID=A0AAF6AM20_MARPO|nr:hypothetical protein MARPO_0043s0005 [Marchantia polymorpha]BBM97490.1 hypothetical protein Mp_1g06130 [Marchantia polymorpha subsp. ruderalis]|eukprot:PTQ39728.1 hypothetical protein MARPO_0043s0005 [Marchantia polymorpha]
MVYQGFLGAQHAILQAPLGPDLSGPALVAAVSNAGGFGFLRAPDQPRPDIVRQLIQSTRELTERPFGIGVVLHFDQDENIRMALEEKVTALWVFWGDFPEEKVDECHKCGVKVVHQIGSVEEAIKAAQAGVDAIVVQGIEAGGHVISQVGLLVLLPAVVDALRGYNVPIIAAGGIVDARGYVAALSLGAQGVCLGTRFVATVESCAHPLYKRKIVDARESDTEYTNLYGRGRWRAPHRVIRTTSHELWKGELPPDGTEVGQPIIGHTTIYDVEEDVPRFSGKVPNFSTAGDVESMVMYASIGVGLIHEILPAASIVKGLVEGAQTIIQQQLGRFLDPSPCREGLTTMV